MRLFSALYAELDASTSTRAKVDALRRYFAAAEPRDAAWAVYFLAGGKPRQVVPSGVLRALACRIAGIEEWLFEASYQAVGDLAETIAHVLPPPGETSAIGLADWVENRLLPLRGLPVETQAERVASYWNELDTTGRFLLTKLIGGGFRVGVSKLLVQRALAEQAGVDPKLVAQRMMGYTDASSFPMPRATACSRPPTGRAARCRPAVSVLPRAPARGSPLAEFSARLRAPADWLVEWKYDGIRAQMVQRAGRVWIWSRGEELVTDRFPEIVALAEPLPDGTVLDGEIVVWKDGAPAPFALLQQRIGRKTLTKKVLADAPVGFIAYDLLERGGVDMRERPQFERARRCSSASAGGGVPRPSPRASNSRRCETRRRLAGAGGAARRVARARRRGLHAQAPPGALRHRPAQAGRHRRRHLVEVEDRAVQRRRGAGLCAGRPRPPRQRLHRLHLRGLEPHAGRCRRGGGGRSRRSRGASRRARAPCSSSPSPRPTPA